MPFILTHISNCPPTDKPWLLSTVNELRDDEARKVEFKQKWTKTPEYEWPGVDGTLKQKIDWAKKVRDVTAPVVLAFFFTNNILKSTFPNAIRKKF